MSLNKALSNEEEEEGESGVEAEIQGYAEVIVRSGEEKSWDRRSGFD